MRCPECGNYCGFSFIDDYSGEVVYQCNSVRVNTSFMLNGVEQRGGTLDHSDRFFTGRGVRVVPVNTGTHKDPCWVARKVA